MHGIFSLFLDPNGGGLNRDFILNLTAEGVGIIFTTVFVTAALACSRWLSVRRPRRKVLDDSRVDADFTLNILKRIVATTSQDEARRELKSYVSAANSMAKRLEVTRGFFSPGDQWWIVQFITSIHTVSAQIDIDCGKTPMGLPLASSSRFFPGHENESIRTLATNYYTQMFYYLDRLFRRYGLARTNVEGAYEPDFLTFLHATE